MLTMLLLRETNQLVAETKAECLAVDPLMCLPND